MGQKSRRAREAERQRRQVWREIVIVSGALLAIVIATAVFVYAQATSAGNGSIAARPPTPSRPIDGIPCQAEQTTYHEHAHLAILDRGKSVPVPAGIGINDADGCFYWLHTHNPDGIIHIEASHKIVPTLGNFFDIWEQPLSRTRVGSVSADAPESMKVFLDQKPYTGNPRDIRLHPHTDITIEIGRPFKVPARYRFPSDY
jgi:hypothetical protein